MFWDEEITIFGALGILIIIPVILISGLGKKQSGNGSQSKSYFIPLILALLSSGGLGVVQKIQQGSEYKNQTNAFILMAFIFCFIISLLLFVFLKKGENKIQRKNLIGCLVVGLTFSTCNLLNTYLAGALDSAVFFPVLNICGILLSMLLGLIIYKEKLTKKDIVVLILAFSAIILVNL